MGCSSGVDWMENGISSAGVLAYIYETNLTCEAVK